MRLLRLLRRLLPVVLRLLLALLLVAWLLVLLVLVLVLPLRLQEEEERKQQAAPRRQHRRRQGQALALREERVGRPRAQGVDGGLEWFVRSSQLQERCRLLPLSLARWCRWDWRPWREGRGEGGRRGEGGQGGGGGEGDSGRRVVAACVWQQRGFLLLLGPMHVVQGEAEREVEGADQAICLIG